MPPITVQELIVTLKIPVNKDLTVWVEKFKDNEECYRFRQVKAVGVVRRRRKKKNKGSPAVPLPMLSWESEVESPSAAGALMDPKISDMNYGHLLAEEFLGPNKSVNVVPMYAYFNQAGSFGAWRNLERTVLGCNVIRKALPKTQLTMEVMLEYNGADARIPSKMTVTFPKGTIKEKRHTFAHRPPDKTPMPVKEEFRKAVLNAQKKMEKEADGWIVTGEEDCDELVIPDPASRYDVLDYMLFKGLLEPYIGKGKGFSIGNGQLFSSDQKRLIKEVNSILSNKNDYVYSDCAQDIYHDGEPLFLMAAERGVHIDHIHPKAQMGSNAFSNAQVVSAAFNMSKGTKTDLYDDEAEEEEEALEDEEAEKEMEDFPDSDDEDDEEEDDEEDGDDLGKEEVPEEEEEEPEDEEEDLDDLEEEEDEDQDDEDEFGDEEEEEVQNDDEDEDEDEDDEEEPIRKKRKKSSASTKVNMLDDKSN